MTIFKIRDKKTGAWIKYGDTDEDLWTTDRQMADELVNECRDYNKDGEVVEVDQ